MSGKHSLAYLDVAKALAIIAVVWGHIATPAGNFLFAWHMPFFFFIGGLFIRPQDAPKTFALRNLERLGIPYLVFGAIGIATEIAKRIALGRPVGAPVDYATGLLFWMDYSHLTGYHHILWFLPALLATRLRGFMLARHTRHTWVSTSLVAALATGGLMLPSQLPFALNQILIALPWTWMGYLCFNHPSWRFTGHHMSYLLAAAAVVSVYSYVGIPTLNLATSELPSPLNNYVFATFFSILLISACSLAPFSGIPNAVLDWGTNTLLIMVAHPYTNNIAHLVVEKWLGGAWYFKFALTLLLLQCILLLKLRMPRAFPFRHT